MSQKIEYIDLKNLKTYDETVKRRLSKKQEKIDNSNKLNSDLVADANATNKFVTDEEKTQITTNKNDITSLQENKENKSNKVTSLSSSSTDKEYPSAKCVYDELSSIKSALNDTIDSLDIQKIVASGNASDFFNIGDKLYFDFDNYTDVRTYTKYNVDYNVLGFEDNAIVAESDKNSLDYEEGPREYTSPSMVLEWNNLIPNTLQFSVPQAWITFKDGLPAGKYSIYITGVRSDWTAPYNAYNNKYITFTLTTDIPQGGQIRTEGGTNNDTWSIKSYNSYNGTLIETATITVESSYTGTLLGENWGTGTGVVDSITVDGNTYRIGRINHHQKVGYGSNRYKYSLYRRWLNSDKKYGEWYEKCEDDEYEVAPSTAQQNMAGFLYGLDPALKELLKPTRLKIVVSDFDKSLADTTENGQGVDVMYDKIFVLTAVQMNRAGTNTSVERGIEGNPYQYYVDLATSAGVSIFANWTTYSVLKKYLVSNTSSAGDYFQSSPYRGLAYHVWLVHASGLANAYYAYNALRVAPACKICK